MLGDTPRLVVFDLDGTLVDTGRDIAVAVNGMLDRFGRLPRSEAEIRGFLGAGARRLVELALAGQDPESDDPDSEVSIDRALLSFAGIYRRNLVVESRPYPGVERLLHDLAAAGVPLAVLSNKPHELTVRVVDELLGEHPWKQVVGARTGVPRKPDPGGLLELCRRVDATPSKCAMVGDTHFDIETAHRAGALPVAVTWGGTPRAELEGHGASFVADRASEVGYLLLGR